MYSSCVYCTASLGRNEAVERFPVGRRLAFDAATGRLWVICRRCERWNLSALEERWEAIEDCERLYRDTRKRVATDQIGLARTADGTDLVRIGRPLRPEFAAWRYGDQFGRRRLRHAAIAAAGLGTVGAVLVGNVVTTASVGGLGWVLFQGAKSALYGRAGHVVYRFPPERLLYAGAKKRVITREHARGACLSRSKEHDGLSLVVPTSTEPARFNGLEAERMAECLMPQINRYGGSRTLVARAVETIEEAGHPAIFTERLARRAIERAGITGQARIADLAPAERLALEMALHEESERRALEGELAALEARWREAAEIAQIADNLLLPTSVTDWWAKLRARASE